MNASTFPISFPIYLGFCIIAAVFFVFLYVFRRRPQQLLLAIAVLASLIIFIDKDNSSLFAAVGWFELIILVAALVFSIVYAVRDNRQKEDVDSQIEVSEDTASTPEHQGGDSL